MKHACARLRVPGLVLMDVRGFRHFVVLKQVRRCGRGG
jgi:predicted double-glycine peptidase